MDRKDASEKCIQFFFWVFIIFGFASFWTPFPTNLSCFLTAIFSFGLVYVFQEGLEQFEHDEFNKERRVQGLKEIIQMRRMLTKAKKKH